MRTKFIITLIAMLAILAGCKKEYRTYPSPNWSFNKAAEYPYSMTAVVKVPKEIKKTINTSDKLAAFINAECRGVGVQVQVNDSTTFFVLIHGTASEQGEIQFKFYDSNSSYMYTTDKPFAYVVDSNLGTADDPVKLELAPVK